MLFVKIDSAGNAVEDPITRSTLQSRLGVNVQLPQQLRDNHINHFGYACVGETLSDLIIDKTTYIKPVVVKNTDSAAETMFTREWELAPYPGNIDLRVANKFSEIREKRDTLLKETDFAASDDYYYMKDQYVAYRNALRDVTGQNSDPFLIVLPERPIDPADDMTLEGRKLYAEYKNEERFRRTLYSSGSIDTTLGFFVKGGQQNYFLIKGARDMGVTSVYDVNNVRQDLTSVQMDTVVKAIEAHTQTAFDQKKTTEAAIEAADENTIDLIITELKS